MAKRIHINQKDNYDKNFGYVYRSSAIYYFKKEVDFKTTINFMNYWPVKRDIEVMVIASLRDIKGNLVKRERVPMGTGMVVNYSPEIEESSFEGSLEMESFAANNLMIPYIAMMVIYEAPESVSMVHACGRTYCPHEVEEGKTISTGEEAGLVARDTENIQSFFVTHNGYAVQPEQEVTIWITNHKGETKEIKQSVPELKPFETLKIVPRKSFPNLYKFLDNKPGSWAVSYKLNCAFTRGLGGSETLDGREMQVLHSNFNYGRHHPGVVEGKKMYFNFPFAKNFHEMTVHLDSHAYEGRFLIKGKGIEQVYKPGTPLNIQMESELLTAEPLDGKLPARINLVFSGKRDGATCQLPMESARGFYHSGRPGKYNLWMPVAMGRKYRSQIIIQTLRELYGEVGTSMLEVALYRENSFEVIRKRMSSKDLVPFERGVYMDDLFPEYCNKEINDIGYLFCRPTHYGGHCAFTTIESETNKSISIEHMF